MLLHILCRHNHEAFNVLSLSLALSGSWMDNGRVTKSQLSNKTHNTHIITRKQLYTCFDQVLYFSSTRSHTHTHTWTQQQQKLHTFFPYRDLMWMHFYRHEHYNISGANNYSMVSNCFSCWIATMQAANLRCAFFEPETLAKIGSFHFYRVVLMELPSRS